MGNYLDTFRDSICVFEQKLISIQYGFLRLLLPVFFLLIPLFFLPKEAAYAQNELRDRYSIWGGHSFNSIRFLGKTRNSETQIFAIGFQHRLRSYPNKQTLWYTADIIPYLHFHYPKRDENNRMVNRTGYGLAPAGFTLTQKTDSFLHPFIQTTGGFIYMNKNFPTDNARRLNFTFDVTIGANIPISHFVGISFGYKFHHISNGQTGVENPGLDSNFLFFNLSLQ